MTLQGLIHGVVIHYKNQQTLMLAGFVCTCWDR